jgi:hypothetical protein
MPYAASSQVAARLLFLIHAPQLMQRVALQSDRFVFPPLLSNKKAPILSPPFVAPQEVVAWPWKRNRLNTRTR